MPGHWLTAKNHSKMTTVGSKDHIYNVHKMKSDTFPFPSWGKGINSILLLIIYRVLEAIAYATLTFMSNNNNNNNNNQAYSLSNAEALSIWANAL